MEVNRYHFASIDSTNTWGKRNAHLFDQTKLTLVTANTQTAGRGRFKRRWESPPGQNIYVSFCFFVKKERTDIGNIPQILSISAAHLLKKLGFFPQIKWPNDLMVDNKKIGGILCETTSVEDQLCLILGIGLNVNMPLEILQGIDRPAVSMVTLDGVQRDCEEVLLLLKQFFIQDLSLFLEKGFRPFLDSYLGFVIHRKGDPIRFHDNQQIWEGAFEKINADGSLVLALSNGGKRTFIAGEIL